MSDASVPVEIPLIERDKAELVRHIGRLEDNLKWYVDERNRLLAAGEARPDLAKFLTDYAEKQFRSWSAQVGDYPDRKSCMEFWRQFKHYVETGTEAYAASSSLLPVGRQTIAFTCGCFASFWDCQSALACCNKHEAPRQTIDNLLKIYEIQFVYKDGLVEVATCEVCSLPIMRTCQRGTIAGWSEWVHNEPLKPQYQKRKCYDRSTTGSTTPDARPIAGSERFDI